MNLTSAIFLSAITLADFHTAFATETESASTSETVVQGESKKPTEAQIRAADEARKSIEAMNEGFKHWMYRDYDLTQNDELAGIVYPTFHRAAILFSRHEGAEKYIVMHIEGTESTLKALKDKTTIWFDLESVAVVMPADKKEYCTYQHCDVRIRFDDQHVIKVSATMGEQKQLTINKPWPIILELKRSRLARVEIIELDTEGSPNQIIYNFDVKGFQWKLKE